MVDLGSTFFNLAVDTVDAPQLEMLSNSLFDEWEAYVDQSLTLPDYSLFLQVEEGSIIGQGKIMSGAKALVIGIVAYGGLMSGVDIINRQLKATSSFLAEHAQSTFGCSGPQATVRKKGGAPAALHRLFDRVQRDELTPDEAFILAKSILDGEEPEVTGFFEDLYNAFRDCPRHPQQAQLPFDEFFDEKPTEIVSGSKEPKPPKRRSPDLPPPLHYRVEVWRDSKGKRKQTKVTVL